jgi:predicted phosphodiesterase
MSNKLHVLLADIHYPVHCRKSIRAVFQFIARHRANIESGVLLGDFLDSENLSSARAR